MLCVSVLAVELSSQTASVCCLLLLWWICLREVTLLWCLGEITHSLQVISVSVLISLAENEHIHGTLMYFLPLSFLNYC